MGNPEAVSLFRRVKTKKPAGSRGNQAPNQLQSRQQKEQSAKARRKVLGSLLGLEGE
jgi:hypothetical protein